MSALNHSLLLGADAGGGAPQVSRSLRFNALDSASLSRTVGTASNTTTWTWAGWVKRSGLTTSGQVLFAAGSGLNNNTRLSFGADDRLNIINEVSSVSTTLKETAAVYRDPGAWMHVVCAVDTNNATASNRVRLYVNGNEITAFNVSNTPSLGLQLFVNSANTHYIGQSFNPLYANFYLADIHLIDGQQLSPTAFGETDVTTNEWIPKAYSGSYGANGFRLDFSDNSAATATTLGKDRAGSNNWTPTNLSITAGTGNDSLVDIPTSYGTDTGVGGEVRGNYCTLNAIHTLTTATLANGNLDFTTATAGHNAIGTIGMTSGKWYWEAQTSAGTTQARATVYGTASSTYYSFAANATPYGFRFDADAGTLDYTTNGSTWTPLATGLTSGPYFPYFNNNGTTSKTITTNFGQRPFAYTAPTGYKALCDTNLPAPTIAKPSTVMDTVLYTGTGASLTPTSSLGFSPDLVWIKGRSGATDHALYDTVRGAQARLESNTTDAEVATDGGLTAFNSNGFTLGTLAQVNTNAATYAGWCWDAGSSTVTNTAGTISSQVRANANAGFSVVTYTGTGANATVGHGLGVAPSFLIVKRRNIGGSVWRIYHSSLGATQVMRFTVSAAQTDATAWNSTAPSSTVFSVGTLVDINQSAGQYVAYCFAPVAGYSAFGRYTGTFGTDGPFAYCGFRPRWLLIKCDVGGTNWAMLDAARPDYNVTNNLLAANLGSAEGTADRVDITSNGFKLRTTDGSVNTGAGTHIYAAFAEFPFQYARAR